MVTCQGEIILEVAGNSPSRLVMIPNPHSSKKNGDLTLSDTACGVGVYAHLHAPLSHTPRTARTGHCVRARTLLTRPPPLTRYRYVSAVAHALDPPAGAGRLEVGDTILSVDGAVTESAKETMKYIARAPDPLTFVVAGRELAAMGMAT